MFSGTENHFYREQREAGRERARGRKKGGEWELVIPTSLISGVYDIEIAAYFYPIVYSILIGYQFLIPYMSNTRSNLKIKASFRNLSKSIFKKYSNMWLP